MTSKHVALLRGINVGGAKKVDMAGLRELFETLGYGDVKTLLNSGNVVFSAAHAPASAAIEKAIRAAYGFDVAVLLRSAAQLRKVVELNPFQAQAHDGSRYFVTFLDRPLAAGALADLDPAAYEPELLYVAAQEIYTWLPGGIRDSPLMKVLTPKRLGATPTARNWNTVTKLAALALSSDA